MEIILGRVVYSKTGRDKGRMFIIVGVMGDRFVTLADGDLRKIEKPKLKNIKHVQFTGIRADEIAAIINRGEMPANHILRKYLNNISKSGVLNGKEVW
ncbi:MAG: RNA-binding protein [Syntrophomonadaceae bacterium]|nr:RNA-binding protein [Syntrophomonadaceae bacterium]